MPKPASDTRRGLRAGDRRTLAAFAEAMIPDSGSLGALPGAGPAGVDAAAAVSRFVAGVPRRQRLVIVSVLRAVEWVTGTRRFSALDVDARTRRLERLTANPLARDLVLLLKALVSFGWARDTRVQEALGVRPRCELAPGAEHPRPAVPPLDASSLRPPEDDERCDVVVVGSGAGGASVARVLAERGLDVIVLEEGHLHDASSYTTDPLDALRRMYRDGGLTVLEGRPAIPLPLGRCVGGTTVINSGTCVRTPDEVLLRWRDDLGIRWATQLDGQFDAIERDLAVTTLDPAVAGRNAELCRRGADAVGAASHPVRRNAGRVVRCGTCPTGCAIDAKQAMHVSELPRAVAAGARLRAGVRVTALRSSSGHVTGVAAVRPGGSPYAVQARAVVLAGGAIGTPELLLRRGLGGHIGRHLHVQPACWVGALFDEEVRGFDGVMQSWHVDEWRSRGLFLEATFTPLPFGVHWLPGVGGEFRRRAEAIGQLAVIGVHLADRSEGRVRAGRDGTRLSYRLTRDDARTLGFGIARAADILFAAGAREAYPQLAGLTVMKPGEQARIETGLRPAHLRLEAFHPMGSARMGGASAHSATDPDGQVRGLPGVYVADGSLLPTALGVNPMITIMAVARHVAAGLADRLA